MSIPSGVQKRLVFAKESTFGVKPATNTGAIYRRVTAEINLTRESFTSAEISSYAQTSDMRLGTDSVEGTLNGELSTGSYKDLFAALLRGSWAAGTTTGTQTTISVTSSTYTRSTGSFITDGFKVGDVVFGTGFTAPANNTQRVVTAVTALVLTVDATSAPLTVAAAGASVTVAVKGKKLSIPLTDALRTNDSFTIEEYFSSNNISRVHTGCKIGSAAFSVQPNAMATVNFGVMGITTTSATGEYFVSPTASSTNSVMSGSSGALYVGGVKKGTVTGLSFDVTGNMERGTVIGSRQSSDIFLGRIGATGQFTCYFEDDTIFTQFINETDISLVFRFTGSGSEEFVVKLPRIKLGGATLDDKEVGGLIQTVPFTALLPAAAADIEQSTIVLQDTTLV